HPSQAKSKSGSPASGTGSQVNPNSLLLPDSTKPTFKIPEPELRKPVTVIAYGDMRFTNPKEKIATDPKIRMELVRRVAKERPDVLLLNGDVPYHGGVKNDYLVYKDETRIWRVEHLRVFPVLGNHEFYGCAPAQCLENWWNTFPKLKDRRWYSVQVGTSIYVIALDSDDSLESGSRQIKWLTGQLDSLSPSIKFVMINLHHPPVADPNPPSVKDKVPRPNEIALRNYLRVAAQAQNAKFVVTASHIHNYERFYQDSVMYLVTGGGGAVPYPVIRTPGDLYKDPKLPNYNYVEFVLQGNVLRGTMYRLSSKGTWQAKDTFDLKF
ncbi:MAG TPA: metallophosphoesterase, partial [Candidatus Dormibacteraeota bacterium]|nr:metallophosphoesterase [Candidatus Dormibacteraeota bacterium]